MLRVMPPSPARRAAGAVAALALALLASTGAVLTWQYRPDSGGSRRLVQAHEASIYVAIVALVLWCALTIADRAQRSRRTAVVVGVSLGAVALVALTAVAWNRVHWVQLGLWAVTVGNGVRGLWYAAFSDDVRFVFVDGMGEHVAVGRRAMGRRTSRCAVRRPGAGCRRLAGRSATPRPSAIGGRTTGRSAGITADLTASRHGL